MQGSLLDQRHEIEQESAQRSVEQRNLRQQQRAQLESNRLQSAPSYLTAQEREPIQNGGSSYPFSTANGQAWQRLPNVHRPPMVRAAPAPREHQGYPSRPIAIPRNHTTQRRQHTRRPLQLHKCREHWQLRRQVPKYHARCHSRTPLLGAL